MIFSLEALQAFHGDALLLHAGTAGDPKLVLIDGGPTAAYAASVEPRLMELRDRRAPDAALAIDLAMVSHIDSDHIGGLVRLGAALVDLDLDQQPLPFDIHTLWHNAFDDILGNRAEDLRTAALDALAAPPPEPRAEKLRAAGRLVVASVAEGRELRDQATRLNWGVNEPFDGLVSASDPPDPVAIADDTRLTVICPHADQLARLNDAWEKWLRKHERREARHEDTAGVAAYDDTSVFNLSSIVVLAEAGGRRMLLCGDARGDHVLAGLDSAGLASQGVTEVDILKLPHHGSVRNVETDFFERIPARHYVISADGRFGNPETETLEMIAAVRGDDDFELHFTNHDGFDGVGARLDAFVAAQRAAGRTFAVSFRDEHEPSLRIDLADPPSS